MNAATDTATLLLAELHARGITIRALPDGRIGARPAEAVDHDVARRIRAQRRSLLELLSGPQPCVQCSRFITDAARCWWCETMEIVSA